MHSVNNNTLKKVPQDNKKAKTVTLSLSWFGNNALLGLGSLFSLLAKLKIYHFSLESGKVRRDVWMFMLWFHMTHRCFVFFTSYLQK